MAGKKTLFRSYIDPIISYGAILWKARKTDIRRIEKVQETVTKGILGTKRLEYKERLSFLLLPLSLYHEMHVLLVFIDIIKGRINMEWKPFRKISETPQNTWASELKENKIRTMTKVKQDSEVWSRGVFFAKAIGKKNLNLDKKKSIKKQNSKNT